MAPPTLSHRWAFLSALVVPSLLTTSQSYAQGCIAVRSCPTPSVFGNHEEEMEDPAGHWTASVAYRFYESGRHFNGDVEQTQRAVLGNNVINTVHSFDLAATYAITRRWSATLDIPFSDSTRSSWYEHDGKTRHDMHSGGLGDIRLLTSYWLLDPEKHTDGNISVGLGIKFPSGDDGATDISYRATGPVRRPVDPSIQPGDGGWGISLDMQAFQKIYGPLYFYAVGSYLFTPEEQSSTEFTIIDDPAYAARFASGTRSHNTIPDQYLGRLGFEYQLFPKAGLSVSLGGRMEGVPAYDVIGGSLGWRRPGYTISVEPGLSWMKNGNSFSVLAPVALYRNRERSAPEVQDNLARGDSAFADYSILASFSHRF